MVWKNAAKYAGSFENDSGKNIYIIQRQGRRLIAGPLPLLRRIRRTVIRTVRYCRRSGFSSQFKTESPGSYRLIRRILMIELVTELFGQTQ